MVGVLKSPFLRIRRYLGGTAVFSFAQTISKLLKKAIPLCGTITGSNPKLWGYDAVLTAAQNIPLAGVRGKYGNK